MRLPLLAACCALLFVTQAAAANPPAANHLQLIDLTPAFASAWARTTDLPDAERVAAFDADFAPRCQASTILRGSRGRAASGTGNGCWSS
jgi:hypothetical protein